MFLIFIMACAVIGITYAWLNISFGEDYAQMAELEGRVVTDVFYDTGDAAITPGKTYRHTVTIENTSSTARAHPRARLSWFFQDAYGVQIAVPRGMIKARLEGDDEWDWVEDQAGTWVGKRKGGPVGGDLIKMVGEGETGDNATDVTVCLEAEPGLTAYDVGGKLLRVRFAVAFEGELIYNTLPAIGAWE
jgi:hypothetical protein